MNRLASLPVKYVILEGPDCSGKTSLYSSLNKATSFVRNIRDRSYLSTLCYARLYDRPVVDELRECLKDELCDANNFFIVLLPEKDVILQRLRSRGDEFQDEDSLSRLYDIFADETSKIEFLPNVTVIRSNIDSEALTQLAFLELNQYEQLTPETLGSLSRMWTKLSVTAEVQFKVRLKVAPDYEDPSVMLVDHEAEYFKEIFDKCKDVIQKEILGENPYEVPQKLDSRRFYYSSDTCISSIHFLNRSGDLKVICQLRSTDSIKNGSPDLRFLSHLSAEMARNFQWNPKHIFLDINYNSLHVRHDKV